MLLQSDVIIFWEVAVFAAIVHVCIVPVFPVVRPDPQFIDQKEQFEWRPQTPRTMMSSLQFDTIEFEFCIKWMETFVWVLKGSSKQQPIWQKKRGLWKCTMPWLFSHFLLLRWGFQRRSDFDDETNSYKLTAKMWYNISLKSLIILISLKKIHQNQHGPIWNISVRLLCRSPWFTVYIWLSHSYIFSLLSFFVVFSVCFKSLVAVK